MGKVYKTVRLAHETKYWIDCIIEKRTKELQKEIKGNRIIPEIREEVFRLHEQSLDGVSISINLNVTNSSIIEQAVRFSRNISKQVWIKTIAMDMEKDIKRIQCDSFDDSIPRLHINEEILEELEKMRLDFKEAGKRIPRLSYVVKLVVYAFQKEYLQECNG
ncbi:MAG TPA: hypothetical protein GX707_10725 [Epulopiscium sp.]|nr:hypothetical protein [Candidatus Epulonipiscium sp.]